MSSATRYQKTLRNPCSYNGIGIHTGVDVSLRFLPAPLNTGILFRRTDLPGEPEIPATLESVVDTSRSTTLGKEGVVIHTVEHVLAACKAYEIDNLIIALSNKEPPVGDGSAQVFVEMIERAGVEEQEAIASAFFVEEPLFFSEEDVHLVALPYPVWKVSYTLHYPESAALQAQYYSSIIDTDRFRKEIAPCRTFSMYDEVSHLMEKGLIKGGSLDNAVVIKDEAVFSKGGLRFPGSEMARHKVLDLIGDLSLIGCDLYAHIIAIRSGHQANYAFAQILHEHITRGTYVHS